MHSILCLLKGYSLLFIVHGNAFANICPSRHYCHTAEVKYRAFHELPGAYLNSTDYIMKTFTANTSRKCMQACTRTQYCQSANHYQKVNEAEMSCDLIQGNKWSNVSLLVKRGNSTHYFIMNSCASNPCKHGGTCISLDQEASYKCACVDGNYTTTIHGANCETVKMAENTSDVYFRFDTKTPVNLQKLATTLHVTGSAKIVNVPDKRKTDHVLYLPGISSSYAYFSGFGNGCPMRIDNCESSPAYGLTVSFWFRLPKRYQYKYRTSSCSHSIYNRVVQSSTSSSQQGFMVTFGGCSNDAFIVYINSYTQSWTLSWGNASDPFWSGNWSNLAFTFLQSEGIVLYVNGAEVKKQTSPSYHGSGLTSYGSYIYMGYEAAASFESYIDDLIIWFKRLTPADISFSYQKKLQLDYNS